MAQDNSSSQLGIQSYQTKKQSASIYFEDKLEKSLEPDWQNKKHKHRCTMFAEGNCKNTTAWPIDSQEKLFT